MVLVDRLDLATARAIQYARSLMPDEVRAVHFILDDKKAATLAADWGRLGLSKVALDLRECSDRVIPKAAIEVTAEALAEGDTEVSVLLPHRKYRGLWHRILHDQTADKISEEVSRLPHANVTLVPFHLSEYDEPSHVVALHPPVAARLGATANGDNGDQRRTADGAPATVRDDGTTPIGFVQFRQRATVTGRVRAMRVQPLAVLPGQPVHQVTAGRVALGKQHRPGPDRGQRDSRGGNPG